MKRTASGTPLHSKWFVYFFGGVRLLPKDHGGGYQWAPSLRRRVKKYYAEGWKSKYTLRQFVNLDKR